MSKRTIKVRNTLTGKVREIRLPGKPAVKKPPVKKKAPVAKEPVESKVEDQGDGPDLG